MPEMSLRNGGSIPYATTSPIKRKGWGHNIVTRAGLEAWYRFRTGLTIATGGVSVWRDSSSKGRNLLQATAAAMPQPQSDGSLVFDGSADYMQAIFTLAQPFTVYLLFQQLTWTSGDIVVGGGVGTNVLISQTTGSPQLRLNAGSSLTNISSMALNTWGVICFIGNGTSSVFQHNLNTAVTGDAGANALGGITLGASATPANFGNVGVKELAVFSLAHDATVRQRMIRYMARVGQVGL